MPNFIAWVKNLVNSIPGLGKPGSKPQRLGRGPRDVKKGKEPTSKDFDSFLLLPIDELNLSPLARATQLRQVASQIAAQVRQALDEAGELNCSLVELYTPGPTWRMLAQVFNTDARMDEFEQICTTEVFGVNPTQSGSTPKPASNKSQPAAGSQPSQRVYLVRRPLNFDPAFERLLEGKLLVRPLGEGGVSIPTDPTEYRRDADQILIGELRIFDDLGQEVDSPLIWAWRAIKNEHTIQMHVDFDVLSRTVKEELHRFPLGTIIQCTMKLLKRKREMQDITLFVREATEWKRRVPEVTYFVETGADPESGRKPIDKDSFPDTGEIHVPRDSDSQREPYPLGVDEYGNPITINIDRQLKIIAKSPDTTYYYLFRFFERAIKYSPGMNLLQVTGQLIPASGPATVYLPPTLDHDQTPLFRLTARPGAQGHFEMQPLSQRLTWVGSGGTADVSPGQSQEVAVGDKITFSPVFGGASPSETIEFELRGLSDIPDEVLHKKSYAAFVHIDSRRVSVLSAREYVLGPNVFFAPDAAGMEKDALMFERPNVFTVLHAAPNQDVWFYDKYAVSSVGAKPPVQKVEGIDGKRLHLNGFYLIYVGDFELSLNLRPTPSSEL